MDRYKKKNMKFMGKGTEVRAAEMNAARRSVRQQRFSLQRPLDDVDQPNDTQSKVQIQNTASKVPTLGIPKPQSRLDMLRKWKEEKELKKRLEMNSKKPVFKVGPARPLLDAMASSRLQALKASRIQPVSKLADITHHKNISTRPDPDTKAIVKTIQTRSIPSTKPQIARLQVNEPKFAPANKPQIGKPLATKSLNPPPTKSGTLYPQTRQNLAKKTSAPSKFQPQTNIGSQQNSSAPSKFKPQTNIGSQQNSSAPPKFKPPTNIGLKATKNLPSNSKPQSSSSVKESKLSTSTKSVAGKSVITKEEKKIPTAGMKPPTLPPLRRPQLQNQQNKSKPVSSVQSKKAVAKAVEKPLNQDPEGKNSTSLDQSASMLSWPLSIIEDSAKEKSFAPHDFVFCPPKIRSSWLDDEGPCTILSQVMKQMNLKPRTSTPFKEVRKEQEMESSFDKGESIITGESSSNAIEKHSSIPNEDSEGSDDTSSPKHSEPENDIKADQTSIEDKAEDSKSSAVAVTSLENEGLDIASVNKEMLGLALCEKENPVTEPADVEKPEPENSVEKNFEFTDERKEDPVSEPTDVEEQEASIASGKNGSCDEEEDVEELADVSSVLVISCAEDQDQNVGDGAEISVFYPSEPVAVAEPKSKRLFSSCWKMEKPSLDLISESPENFLMPATPKSHRRKGLLREDFTPRRSQRLARKSELKEENIFEVKECFLDSPSVEAATRMSIQPYEFDRLHLEAQGNSNGAYPTRSNRGKVSLLYTPPRQRASTRKMSLRGDLISFSPNVE